MKAIVVVNNFHLQRLGVMKGRPKARSSLRCLNSRMLKIILIGGINKKL